MCNVRLGPEVLFHVILVVLAANVRVTSSKNGWMTSPVLLEWTRRVWGPNADDVRRLLILDQAPIHKTEAAREALDAKDTDVVLIPGGCTSILQPADVSWMKPFKDALRGIWASFFRKGSVTPKGNLRKPSRQEVVDLVAQAWASVSEDTVRSSFKRCGISTRLDGSEDGELNDRLASVTNGPEDPESLIDEALDLIFDSESDVSFDGFSDES